MKVALFSELHETDLENGSETRQMLIYSYLTLSLLLVCLSPWSDLFVMVGCVTIMSL